MLLGDVRLRVRVGLFDEHAAAGPAERPQHDLDLARRVAGHGERDAELQQELPQLGGFSLVADGQRLHGARRYALRHCAGSPVPEDAVESRRG
jgi:hypothetical protein